MKEGQMSKPIKEIRQPGEYAFTFGPFNQAVAEVEPGETVRIHTLDAFGNKIQSPGDSVSERCNFPFVNPQTGPIIIRGAEKGDILVVKIDRIEPARDFAVTAIIPYFGALTNTDRTVTLNEPLAEDIRFFPIKDGYVHLFKDIKVPYRPFTGTIGVAPELEAISSLTPGNWGGNMDCHEMCPGNELQFPVFVDGAHFFTGDVHAAQGDGEITGVACEIPAIITLSFDLIKGGKTIHSPRVISDKEIMVVGNARPMEDAARIAWGGLIEWMVESYGFTQIEAYHLLGQVGKMRVGNMVDPNYSVVSKCPKEYLSK
jgi:acetamidase/formamidase